GWLVLGGLAVRQSLLGRPALRLDVALLIDLGVLGVHAVHAGDAGFPAAAVYQSGILVVTALAVLAADMIRRDPDASEPAASKIPVTRTATDAWVILVSFVFALYFAAADASPHLVPLGAMLAVLVACAAWAARAAAKAAWIALASSIATLVVLA